MISSSYKKSGIYEIYCHESGKRYIGSAINIYNRFHKHRSMLRSSKHSNPHFQSAFNKYGEEAFKFKALLYCDKENLLFYEQRAIDTYGMDRLYNLSPTANSCLGVKHSEETCKKISEARIGKPAWNKGIPLSQEQKDAVSKANKGNQVWLGRKHSEETKQKLRELHTGKKLSEEHKRRIGDSGRGKPAWNLGKEMGPCSDERRENISNALKGKVFSESHIETMKIAQQKRWERFRLQKLSSILPS